MATNFELEVRNYLKQNEFLTLKAKKDMDAFKAGKVKGFFPMYISNGEKSIIFDFLKEQQILIQQKEVDFKKLVNCLLYEINIMSSITCLEVRNRLTKKIMNKK